jgi:hypothetical protein
MTNLMDESNRPASGLFGYNDAAVRLGGVSAWTLRKHVARGNIAATRIGRRLFLSEGELRRIEARGLPSLTASPGPRATSALKRQKGQTDANERGAQRTVIPSMEDGMNINDFDSQGGKHADD